MGLKTVKKIKTVKDLEELRAQLAQADSNIKSKILVCSGTGCSALGSRDVFEALVKEAKQAKLSIEIELTPCSEDHNKSDENLILASLTGCQGFCQIGPLVHIVPQGILYTGVKPQFAKEIVETTLIKGEAIEKLLYKDPETNKKLKGRNEIPFYKGQKLLALEGCGTVAADSFYSYLVAGGFLSLSKAFSMSADAVITEVEKSGLRGRGGGGFATGKKWRSCVNASCDDNNGDDNNGDERFVICNGDEGDPGAFMDCCIMEGDPYRVIEGMIICAYSINSKQGFIYVRHEYPKAIERLSLAIEECRKAGILGENILGSNLSFDIKIARGGGAFVCGESTALMRSIEGNVGEPRAKYIRSVQKGLYDKPTVLNNVETFACIPKIIQKGSGWFASLGTDKSSGTKAFCLVGKVVNTGLIEVAMGTTLRDVVFKIGGGIIDDRPFKAVQTGGPSGGCLTSDNLDLPVDFDALTKAGSMMGSGGMIVMDDRTCMVDVAKYFLHFLIEESCGKCVPCREGVAQLYHMLEKLTLGEGQVGDLEKIEKLGKYIQKNSLCGLGKSAPNPVLSTIENFREEYEAHINDKKCPAGVCRDLTIFEIDENKCTGCMVCKKACPPSAISGKKKQVHVIDQEKCTQCGACRTVCKFDAVATNLAIV